MTLATGLAAVSLGLAPTMIGAKEITRISFMEVIHSLFYSPLYVALDRGFFE